MFIDLQYSLKVRTKHLSSMQATLLVSLCLEAKISSGMSSERRPCSVCSGRQYHSKDTIISPATIQFTFHFIFIQKDRKVDNFIQDSISKPPKKSSCEEFLHKYNPQPFTLACRVEDITNSTSSTLVLNFTTVEQIKKQLKT